MHLAKLVLFGGVAGGFTTFHSVSQLFTHISQAKCEKL